MDLQHPDALNGLSGLDLTLIIILAVESQVCAPASSSSANLSRIFVTTTACYSCLLPKHVRNTALLLNLTPPVPCKSPPRHLPENSLGLDIDVPLSYVIRPCLERHTNLPFASNLLFAPEHCSLLRNQLVVGIGDGLVDLFLDRFCQIRERHPADII